MHHALSIMHQPMLEDDLWWTTTFGGRRPLVEDDLRRTLHAAHSSLIFVPLLVVAETLCSVVVNISSHEAPEGD